MFRTRVRKIWGDIFARRGRTALVSIAIFIGVAGTIALFSMGDILVGQIQEDINEDELSMLYVFTYVNVGDTVIDDAYLGNIREIEGVTDAFGFVAGANNDPLVQYKINETDEEYDDALINAFTEPYEPELPLEPMRLLEGGAYPQSGANELAVEQRFAEKHDLQVGDTIYVRVLSESRKPDLNGEVDTVEDWTVSGIVFHPYSQAPRDSVYAADVADALYVSGAKGLSGFAVRFTDYETALAQEDLVVNYLANETPYNVVFKISQDPEQNQLVTGAQQISGTMGFLALVALVVSGFLVINVISSIVVEQKRQIGVMKSMGATRWDTFFIYGGIAFAYGLLGVIPGVIVGIPGGNAAAQGLAPTLNTLLEGFQMSPGSIILGVLVGLLVPVFASIIPVFFGTRVKILDAMTDLGIDVNYGKGPIARMLGALPIPITVRQGLSNVSLKKSRLAFTVITLAIAAGAFMGIFSVFNSFTSGIDVFLDTFNVEVAVGPNEGRSPEEFIGLLEDNFQTEDNNVLKSIEPGSTLQVEFEGYDPPATAGGPPGILGYGYAVESESPAFSVTVDRGEELTLENSEDGIVLSSLLATNMGKDVGDTVVMKVPGNEVELKVVGIAEFPLDQIWLDWRTLALASGSTLGVPRPNEYQTIFDVEGYSGSLDGNQVTVAGLDTQLADFIPFSEGEFFTPGEPGVIINQTMADNGDYAVGDVLTITTTVSDTQTDEYPIVGIFELPPFIPQDELPEDFIGINFDDLVELEGLSLDGDPLPQAYFLISNLDDPSVDNLKDLTNDISDFMLTQGIQTTTFNFVELTEQISQAFIIFQVVLQLVAGLIAIVGALGLLTTLSMSVYERQKEIGVMRSIGASSRTVATQFLTEGVVVGVIAWLVGLPLAYFIQVGLLQATQLEETFPATFPLEAAIIGLVGMMVITMIASLWPSISAARRTVSDILRYQ